jgi:zinc/manganese transport system permease protein
VLEELQRREPQMVESCKRALGGASADLDFLRLERTAFAAAGVVAIVAGPVGYFLVLRGQTFAGHALAHVGFTGATGAVLIGVSPFWGLVLMTVAAGIAMGVAGERLAQRDVAIGLILALSLGFGLLFLSFYTRFATEATTLLFGNVLAVDPGTVWALLGVGAVSLLSLAAFSRPLLFASLQPELAEAKGVSLRLYAALFLAIVALATALCAQIVGVLLVFALMVGPAAAAHRLTKRVASGVLLASGLALAEAWLGIALAYYTDWPISFWITLLSVTVYLAAALPGVVRSPAPAQAGTWSKDGAA